MTTDTLEPTFETAAPIGCYCDATADGMLCDACSQYYGLALDWA